jgi:hypothetical protein
MIIARKLSKLEFAFAISKYGKKAIVCQAGGRYFILCMRKKGQVFYCWGDRFKSVIVENGETLINCLAYIDLHPVK